MQCLKAAAIVETFQKVDGENQLVVLKRAAAREKRIRLCVGPMQVRCKEWP